MLSQHAAQNETASISTCDTGGVTSTKQWTIVTVAWIALIFFSSTSLAGRWSEGAFRFIANLLFGQALRSGASLYGVIHLVADKGVHVTLFTVLGILLWMCLPNASKQFILILLIGTAVGSLSEYLQFFFPGRDPAIRDVIINVVGTGFGIVVMNSLFAASSKTPPELV